MSNALMLIDCQKDFTTPTGSLFVPGADKDMERLADVIDRSGDNYDSIFLTIDSHNVYELVG